MSAPDALVDTLPPPGFPASREDFPYSLQAYATAGRDAEPGDWTLFLYRATDPAERAWLRAHGFTLNGRLWVRESGKNG